MGDNHILALVDAVVSRHGFHPLRVKAIVDETAEARSFVLDVPPALREAFHYRAGQFCTFRVSVDGDEQARCYSMSSAPETDDDLTVTVKRVALGVVSNWLNDQVGVGDVLEVTRPAGSFCVGSGAGPVIAFCGGSGVTPVLSIAKSVLATSRRPVDLLYANRDRDSVIFADALGSLQAEHGPRLGVRHHLDAEGGFLDAAAIARFVQGRTDADFYICGPAAFMDLVESTLLDLGVAPAAISIERFATPGPGSAPVVPGGDPAAIVPESIVPETIAPGTIALILRGKTHEIAYVAGDTVLETARRANLSAPYSCEAGNCATCMALVRDGSVTMRVNDALDPDEVAQGWVLTCQSVPTSPSLTIEYEPL